MAKFKKCTEKDISVLLDTTSESGNELVDEYIPKEGVDNDSDSTDSETLFDDVKDPLEESNALEKRHTSLRLRLKRSTEHSLYRIENNLVYETPRRSTRKAKHQLETPQDENRIPRKGARVIKVPTRYSDYDCSTPKTRTSVLQRGQINYNEQKLFLASLNTNDSRKIESKKHANKSDDSDIECTFIKSVLNNSSLQSMKLNTASKINKRNHVSSVEDTNSDDGNDKDTNSDLSNSFKRSSKRIAINVAFKRNNLKEINKKPLNEKLILNSATNTIHADSTPRRRGRIKTSDCKNISSLSNKRESEGESQIDQVSFICDVTKDLSINKMMQSTKHTVKRIKGVTDTSVISNGLSTPKSRVSLKHSALTPSLKLRTETLVKPVTPLQEARARLHVSAVPKSLPCREEEFNNIYTFLEVKLTDNSGGCIYISGVPGTGKTATVNEVVKCLKRAVTKRKLEHFDFVEINGMKLSEPRQAYVQILKQLSGKVLTWEQAYNTLEKRFKSSTRRPMTLLLVDELDLLCTKRQDVVYSLLDWPTKVSAQLIVITIANTMDLPERVLMGRVTSRLGLTRITFQPYNYKQLQEIVLTRLKDTDIFKNEAIQLISRKVSAVSGDARRALDICRRAAEITEIRNHDMVSMQDVNQALSEMIATPKVQAIRHCSKMEQIFLQAVCAEVTRTGVEEVFFKNVYKRFVSLCSFDGFQTPNITVSLAICARLGASRLLICEHSRNDIYQKIFLNVSKDDIHYALQPIDLD